MRAAVVTKYGSPDVIQITDVPKPTPKDNEVLIKVHATTVTSGDARLRGFNVPGAFGLIMPLIVGFGKPRNPIFGAEFTGEVVAAGKDVTRFKVGDEVFAMTGLAGGGYGEYTAVPASSAIMFKPTNLTDEEAAGIGFGGTTALYFLREANIQPGQKVLIYGASGCVGTFLVQLAKYFGAEVTGICSTKNIELVQSIGADKVIDYTGEDFTNNGETYDIILDTVGKTKFAQCKASLTPDGKYAQISGCLLDLLRPIWNKQFISGVAPEKEDDLVFLKERIEAGQLKPVIDRCYPLEQIAEAHRYVDTGRKRGNVVIIVNNKQGDKA